MLFTALLLPLLACDVVPLSAIASPSAEVRLDAALAAFSASVDRSVRIEVFSLMPLKISRGWKGPRLEGWPVHHRVTISAPGALEKARTALRSAIAVRPAGCQAVDAWRPRHALIIHSPGCTVEAFIDFDGQETLIGVENQGIMSLVADPRLEAFLDRVLRIRRRQ